MSLSEFMYKGLRRSAEIAGYNLAISKRSRASENYEPILPYSNYAPWLTDHDFNDTYRRIKEHTMVDKYRCYELWQIIEETKKLKGALLEVGVWRGGSGALIAKKTEICRIEEDIYLCDTFEGVAKAGSSDSSYEGGEHSDTSIEIVEELIHNLDLRKIRILKGVFPEDTGHEIENREFRFCHIDVDVYQSAKDILEWVWSRLVVGGIVVFDDYGFFGCDGVTRLVNDERMNADRLIIHNLNGHAIFIKL